MFNLVKAGGAVGIPGLYVTEDPGAVDKAAQQGSLSLRLGLGWAKSQSFFTGQVCLQASVQLSQLLSLAQAQ